MPATDETGGRVVCERLAKLFNEPHQTYDRVSFNMTVFVGMASISDSSSLTSSNLTQQASKAMGNARDSRLTIAVIFSEIT
jgi:GGDEF domain-containing protein